MPTNANQRQPTPTNANQRQPTPTNANQRHDRGDPDRDTDECQPGPDETPQQSPDDDGEK
jgi:hypothetical protein